ncbi:MAG: hypothetical protein QF425_11435, partial [Dehalococcoidia bacterium]|nr:hypothetical protein [Dehalococcoidia bacterium]
QLVVRNGHLPQRKIMTGLGAVEVEQLTLPPGTSPYRMLVNSAWTHSGKGKDMARKKHRAEEIIPKLRAMEVHIAKGLKGYDRKLCMSS